MGRFDKRVAVNHRRTSGLALWAALAGLLASCSEPPSGAASSLSSIDCPEHDIGGEVYCRELMVPEDRRVADGRQIPIRIMVLAATGDSRQPDPLLVIPGGPGQSAIAAPNLRGFFAEFFAPVRKHRDVVLVDQRGTGGSNPLLLQPSAELLYARTDVNLPPAWGRAALPRLSELADLARYTTADAAFDLDAVRSALQAQRINLYGTSYGTRVAQYYLKRFGEHARSAVLKAVSPPGDNIALSYGSKPQRSLELLFDLCTADPACNDAFPELRTQLHDVLARLEQAPVSVDITHPQTGAPSTFQVTRGNFAFGIRVQMMNTYGFVGLPALISDAHAGDFSSWAAFLSQIPAVYSTQLYGGMTFSVIATEDASRLNEAAIRADADDTLIGDTLARSFLEVAEFWPHGEAPDDLFAPLVSDVPVLLVSGALDPATPPEGANAMLPGLPNGRHIVFTGGSHSAANFDGLPEIMATFIDQGSIDDVDLDAVRSNRLPPFAVGESD